MTSFVSRARRLLAAVALAPCAVMMIASDLSAESACRVFTVQSTVPDKMGRNTPAPAVTELTTVVNSALCLPATHTVKYDVTDQDGSKHPVGPFAVPAQTTVMDSNTLIDLRGALGPGNLVNAKSVDVTYETTSSVDVNVFSTVTQTIEITDADTVVGWEPQLLPEGDDVDDEAAAKLPCAPQVELRMETAGGIPSILHVHTSFNANPACAPALVQVDLTFRTEEGQVTQTRQSFQQASPTADFDVPTRGLPPPWGDVNGNLVRGVTVLGEGVIVTSGTAPASVSPEVAYDEIFGF